MKVTISVIDGTDIHMSDAPYVLETSDGRTLRLSYKGVVDFLQKYRVLEEDINRTSITNMAQASMVMSTFGSDDGRPAYVLAQWGWSMTRLHDEQRALIRKHWIQKGIDKGLDASFMDDCNPVVSDPYDLHDMFEAHMNRSLDHKRSRDRAASLRQMKDFRDSYGIKSGGWLWGNYDD